MRKRTDERARGEWRLGVIASRRRREPVAHRAIRPLTESPALIGAVGRGPRVHPVPGVADDRAAERRQLTGEAGVSPLRPAVRPVIR